jgi:glycosyltransferase involved in cell wall biosynthesis
MNLRKILLIGPFPEPISGVSLSNKVVQQILENDIENKVSIINTSYPFFKDSIGSFSLKKAFFFLKVNCKAFKIFQNDIIYTTPGQTFFGILKYAPFILISSFLNKELIIHVHGNYLGTQYKELKGFKKKIEHFLISKYTKGIVLSPSLKSNLIPFLEESKIVVLYNFAEKYLYEHSINKNFNKLKIIYLSNLMEEKGILYLLEALKDLENQNIDYEAKIAGNIDDMLKDKIFEVINSLKNTSYEGVLQGIEKKQLLDWSTIFVLPTFYKMEGQPISILEALASQNLIIATNHAGIPDIIQPKINGFFVEERSSKSILDCLIYLNNNKDELKNIAINNKSYFMKNFTFERFSTEILNIFYANSRVR